MHKNLMNDSAFFVPIDFNQSLVKVTDNSVEIGYLGKTIGLFLQQGRYKFEAYGAGGGAFDSYYTAARNTNDNGCLEQTLNIEYANVQCNIIGSTAGAGGYVSGIIQFNFPVNLYVTVGGAGSYGPIYIEGGFNGGGAATSVNKDYQAGSGGGATDFRLFSNSLFHRILVAGGGGGSDNANGEAYDIDDGSGGAGGLPAQGMWDGGIYQSDYETSTTQGFSFGQGQIGNRENPFESAGAGGGFFGGKTINSSNAGGAGGSSFALHEGILIPSGYITVTDQYGNITERKKYVFTHSSPFKFQNVEFATGVRHGNGVAKITCLELFETIKMNMITYCKISIRNRMCFFVVCLLFMDKKKI